MGSTTKFDWLMLVVVDWRDGWDGSIGSCGMKLDWLMLVVVKWQNEKEWEYYREVWNETCIG